MRLGFAITTPDLADALAAKIGPWAVSGPALWAGVQALNDRTWAEQTRAKLNGEMNRLKALLTGVGMRFVGGTDLFSLVESEQAAEIYERLGRAGILVRPFDDYPNWLRFGLPGSDAHWARLEAVLND